MTELQESRRKKARPSRQRQQARKRRQETVEMLRTGSFEKVRDVISRSGDNAPEVVQDMWWRLSQRDVLMKVVPAILILVVVVSLLSFFASGRLGPNIYVLDTSIGGLTVDEAQDNLSKFWQDDLKIDIVSNGEFFRTVSAEELGLRINSVATVEAAQGVGLGGIPFAADIEPVILTNVERVQTLLLDMNEDVYLPPFEAGYEWQGDDLVGVRGRSSRELDLTLTMERYEQEALSILRTREFEIFTKSSPPSVVDPSPFLDEAYQFVSNGFEITGYDPFRHEYIPFSTSRGELAKWVAAGPNGITLRDDAFELFIDAINQILVQADVQRYIDESEAIAAVESAISGGAPNGLVRVRYLPSSYTIVSGDTGNSVGRKTGLPFRLIEEVNQTVEWNQLSIGQEIQIPSKDQLLEETVVPEKRIVIDLERLWLVAFENEQIVHQWEISSGRPDAPSLPGIYQILSKVDVAFGSSYALCDNSGCGQWEMNWFMGIYEVLPGLTNGFHGGVLLPNGGYLGGGATGARTTYGCVMSRDDQAKVLFDWAEPGVIVEILSDEFEAQSELGTRAMEFIDSVFGIPA